MQRHTPGPWRLGYLSAYALDVEADGRGDALATVYAAGERLSAEDTANARLIAAAPDGHAVLTALGAWLDGGCRDVSAAARLPDGTTLGAAVRAYLARVKEG